MKFAVQLAFLVAVQLLACRATANEPAIGQAEATAAFERGKGLLETGKVDEAIKALEIGTQSVEKEVLARANLARAYLVKEETEQAAEIADEALRVAANRIRETLANGKTSAVLYVDQGFARIVRREVLQKALANEGTEYNGHGVLEAAVEDFERAIDLDSKCFHAYRFLAWSQLTLGNCRKSIEACDGAIELQPEHLDVYSYKVRACLESERGRAFGELMVWGLSEMGEPKDKRMPENAADEVREMVREKVGVRGWEEALAACNAALEIEPQNPKFLLLRSDAYDKGDMPKKAIADCDQVIALDPKNTTAYLYRGGILIDRKDIFAALEDFEKAARIDSRSIAYPGWLANLFLYQPEFGSIPEEKAMALVDRICAAAPNVGEAYLLRAIANQAYEHQEAAEKAYKKAFDVGLSVASKGLFTEID